MQVNRNGNIFLKLFNKRVSVIREKQVCHILNADNISTHLFKGLCHIYKVILIMNRAYGIAHCRLADTAVLLTALHRLLHVAGIVKRVKNTDYVDAVFNRLFDKHINNIVGVMLIA